MTINIVCMCGVYVCVYFKVIVMLLGLQVEIRKTRVFCVNEIAERGHNIG